MSAQAPGIWTTYRRLLGYARRYWHLLAAAVLGMTIEAGAAAAFTTLMDPLINQGFVARDAQATQWLPLAIVGIFLLRGFATFATDYGMARAGRSVVRDLRNALLAKYLHLPSARFDAEGVPALASRLAYDTEQVAQASSEALKVIVTDTLLIAGCLGVMFWQSTKVTLSMLVMGPLIAAIVWQVGKRYRRINRNIADGVAAMGQSSAQSLYAQQEVKIYGAQDAEIARYSTLAGRNLRLNTKIETTRAISSSLVQIFAAVALAIIVWIASSEAQAGRLNAGQFVSLMTAMMAMLPSLKRITTVQSAVQRGLVAADHIFGVLDSEQEVDTGTRRIARARGEVEFRGVSLRYPGQQQAALRDISFVAKPGTVTAIVGRSGGGKSSLVRLIPRFYEPDAGQVLLDGVPLADYVLADLRRQIAFVGQKVMLFDDSVATNIAYGRGDASEAEVHSAAAAANALEFAQALPQGLDTRIGENGALLSGGQRQRLAIARAILKDAPILILDEATAALDNESERLVQGALEHLIPDRTTLVIAHRLSTIEHADQVLVLDGGHLVECGTHAGLLAKGGMYAHLHRMQFREAETA